MANTRRVGVFLCSCEGLLDSALDFPGLAERLSGVSGGEELSPFLSPCWCSPLEQAKMEAAIRDAGLEKWVLACCDGQRALRCLVEDRAAGVCRGFADRIIDLYAFCAAAHKDREQATDKAERYVRMAAARIAHSVERAAERRPVRKRVLVLGGSAAAEQLAQDLVGQGIPVVITTGGASSELLQAEGLTILQDAEPVAVSGSFGQMTVRVSDASGKETLYDAGAIVVALPGSCSTEAPRPVHLGEARLSLEDLERLALPEAANSLPGSVGLWLEPDGEGADMGLSKRALQAALKIRSRGTTEVSIFFRHIPLPGHDGQALYDELRQRGAKFFRLGGQRPKIRKENGRLAVTFQDAACLDASVRVHLDHIVIIGRPVPPSQAGRTARLVDEPLDVEGFLQKDNVHLYPCDAFRRGVFFLGRCREENSDEGILQEMQALEAALMPPLLAGEVEALETIRIDPARCVSCLTCFRACPHEAIEVFQGHPVPRPVAAACLECGLCAALCPGRAIELLCRPVKQVEAEIREACRGNRSRPPVLVFACARSGWRAAEEAGRLGLFFPPEVLFVPLPCACSISEEVVTAAFLEGAEKVFVAGCHQDNCRSQLGTRAGGKRLERVQRYLEAAGREPSQCLGFLSLASNEPYRLVRLLQDRLEGGRAEGLAMEGGRS